MPLTAQQIVNLMKHALGKTPNSNHSLWVTLNHAGQTLYRAANRAPWYHQWSWLVLHNVRLTIPAGATEFAVPPDFSTPIATNFESSSVRTIHWLTGIDLSDERQRSVTGETDLWISFESGAKRAMNDAHPMRVAQVYPAQDAATTFLVTYVKAWPELLESDPDAVPDIDPEYEDALVEIARHMAVRRENADLGAASIYENPTIVAQLETLVQLDIDRQPVRSATRHSVMRSAMRGGGDMGSEIYVREISQA